MTNILQRLVEEETKRQNKALDSRLKENWVEEWEAHNYHLEFHKEWVFGWVYRLRKVWPVISEFRIEWTITILED